MSETFYLPREQQAELVELLDQVPFLVEQLAITITRQDRLGAGPRISRGKTEQPLPFNVDASEVADRLHWELAQWVRAVCEQRQLDYDSRDDTISLARWLRRWIIALALTEGSETALIDIEAVIFDARRAIDRPPRNPPPRDDDEARRALLNASGIEKLAQQLDPRYRTLTAARVDSLHRAGHIEPVHNAGGIGKLYLVGDVLDAHLTVKTRRRRQPA